MSIDNDTINNLRGTAQIVFAQDALRGIVLLNGGAIIALLSFFGQAWAKNEQQAILLISTMKTGMLYFVFGSLSGILAQGLAYLAQQNFVDERRSLAIIFRRTCVTAAVGGMYFFGHGSIASVTEFISK